MNASDPGPLFDRFADEYDAALERGLALTGEGRDYYARERVAWLRRCLARADAAPRSVLDYGCGTGDTVPLLADLPGVERVTGVDVSAASLARARERHARPEWVFVPLATSPPLPGEPFDLIYTNGVFHHIPPAERPAAVAWLAARLRPGGWLAFWENNPWNPGTRWIMRRVPFDADAQPLSAPTARRLLRAGGFRVIRADFRFVFPRALRPLRRWEPALARLPLGGQYQVLARRESA
jgi:SAM-dependent methyltransferase